MAKSTANREGIAQELLDSTEYTRDALPYTAEFDRLYELYLSQSSSKPTKQQFWRMLSNAAKRGGWKGKKRGEPAPELSLQDADKLRVLVSGKLGSRDSLAYTPEFEQIRQSFISQSGLNLSEPELWRAIGNLGKRSMRPDVEALLKQSVDSLVLGVEHFNRPSDRGRQASVLLMLDHACEMLLKAALLQRCGEIRNPKTGYTHSFEFCVNRATDDAEVKFLSEDERRTLFVLNGLRDQAQHYLVDVSEQILYTVSQGTVTLFADLLARLFGRRLCDHLPERVLPISVNPPRDIQVLMDDEFTQLKHLLATGPDGTTLLEPRLRSLVTIDRALNLQEVQISEEAMNEVRKTVEQSDDWEDVFKGISQVKLSADGSGINLAIHITKREGIPVRLAVDGETAQATIAIRKVNDTDFYCFNTSTLAKKVGQSGPKTLALIKCLKLQDDPECFKQIVIGKSQFKMYSSKALDRLKAELPKLNLDEVWVAYGPKPKKAN